MALAEKLLTHRERGVWVVGMRIQQLPEIEVVQPSQAVTGLALMLANATPQPPNLGGQGQYCRIRAAAQPINGGIGERFEGHRAILPASRLRFGLRSLVSHIVSNLQCCEPEWAQTR
jgi:hypothetical protein